MIRACLPHGIIVDTNLLLLLLIGSLQPHRIESFKPTASHFIAEDFDRLSEVLYPARNGIVVTTPILSETSNLLKKSLPDEEEVAVRAALARSLTNQRFIIREVVSTEFCN